MDNNINLLSSSPIKNDWHAKIYKIEITYVNIFVKNDKFTNIRFFSLVSFIAVIYKNINKRSVVWTEMIKHLSQEMNTAYKGSKGTSGKWKSTMYARQMVKWK